MGGESRPEISVFLRGPAVVPPDRELASGGGSIGRKPDGDA
jgi:hypothetical protein